MDFLEKEDAEDNLMRVADKNIAGKLPELTFGNTPIHLNSYMV